jgi:hypothetical protein
MDDATHKCSDVQSKDAPSMENPTATTVENEPVTVESTTADTSTAKKPKTMENPTADTSIAEEPKTVENPTADTSSAKEQTVENPTADTSIAKEQTVEIPTADTSVAKEPETVENPVLQPSTVRRNIALLRLMAAAAKKRGMAEASIPKPPGHSSFKLKPSPPAGPPPAALIGRVTAEVAVQTDPYQAAAY